MPARSKPRHRRSRIGTRIPSGPRKRASGVEKSRGLAVSERSTARPRNRETSQPRIGVISDTHGLIRPEALQALAGVDAILHAGDIGGDHVIDALREIAPVTFVRGNNDDSDGYEIARVNIGDLRILLTHIFRPELVHEDVDVIVFGHSHHPHNEVAEGVLLFNPGSAGPRRFKLPVMVGMIEGKTARHINLQCAGHGISRGKRTVKDLPRR